MTSKAVLLVTSFLSLVSIPLRLSAAVWYVDGSIDEPGGGESWESAFETIQNGIDPASDGDTVLVAEGTYYENIHFRGKNIFVLSTHVCYPEALEKTVIDGNQAGPVVTFLGTEGGRCGLAGFTIRNGFAYEGGGIKGNGTHAAIECNIITGNTAVEAGGGMYGCDCTMTGNIITGNTSAMFGGGLANCNGVINNDRIIGNLAGEGGGFYGCNGAV